MTFEKLKGFRGINSKFTGHGEAHLNPEGVLLSNGPLGSALPQSQGLAMADKVTGKNDRVTICTVSDGASMEGESKEAFAAIAGLAAKDRLNPYLLVISDNDTKLSGRITEQSFSMAPTFNAMSVLGWNVIRVEEGNDLHKVYLAVERGLQEARANPRAPVCLWLDREGLRRPLHSGKLLRRSRVPFGKTAKKSSILSTRFTGALPKSPPTWPIGPPRLRRDWEQKEAAKKAKPVAPAGVKKDKIQSGLAKGAVRAAQEGLPVYSLSADLAGSTGMSFFQKSFPDRVCRRRDRRGQYGQHGRRALQVRVHSHC